MFPAGAEDDRRDLRNLGAKEKEELQVLAAKTGAEARAPGGDVREVAPQHPEGGNAEVRPTVHGGVRPAPGHNLRGGDDELPELRRLVLEAGSHRGLRAGAQALRGVDRRDEDIPGESRAAVRRAAESRWGQKVRGVTRPAVGGGVPCRTIQHMEAPQCLEVRAVGRTPTQAAVPPPCATDYLGFGRFHFWTYGEAAENYRGTSLGAGNKRRSAAGRGTVLRNCIASPCGSRVSRGPRRSRGGPGRKGRWTNSQPGQVRRVSPRRGREPTLGPQRRRVVGRRLAN